MIGIIVAIVAALVLAVIAVKQINTPEKVEAKYANSSERENIFVKKYKEADPIYFQAPFMRLGAIAVIVVLILAFNFSPKDDDNSGLIFELEEEEIEIDIPNTQQVQPPPPPPPPPPPQIEIVEDEEIIEEEPEIEEVEVEMDEEVEIVEVVEVEVEEIIEEEPEEPEEPEIFTIVEQNAEFPGGMGALMEYLAKNINYPPIAQENGIEGRVVLRFVVDEVGGISDVQVLRDIGGGCGQEAIRVVKKMPKWKPGKQRGRAVKQYYTLPVKFTLN